MRNNFWLCLFGACGIAFADPKGPVITLERGACERRCAVYSLKLFADGTVIYDGKHYVRKVGRVREKMDPTAVQTLLASFDAAGYFDLDDAYGGPGTCLNDAMASKPMAVTSVSSGTRSKTIRHHHCSQGAIPDQLTELENSIDRVARTRRWIR